MKKVNWNYTEIWNKFPIPSRPCKKELIILEKELLKKKNPKVLILGSTIEYRSLCKKLKINPIVVDFSKYNYDKLTSYSNEKLSNEIFIEKNWLNINFLNKFDFILGHRAFNVIDKKDILLFFKKMYLSLKKEGIFFCRGNIFSYKYRNKLEYFLKKHANIKNKYPLFTYIEVALYMKCSDKDLYVDYKKCRNLITKFYDSKLINKKEFNKIILLISMPDETRFRSVYKKEIISNYKKAGFNRSQWIITDDIFSSQMPMIKLTK